MKTISLLLLLLFLSVSTLTAQTPQAPAPESEEEGAAVTLAAERGALLLDLRALETEAKELIRPIDAASAKAEIADAAWTLEREWAKRLLGEALELTFPAEIDRKRLRERSVGSRLNPPTPEETARRLVRRRILKIAGRDRAFADELSGLIARELDQEAQVMQYAGLADGALMEGKLEAACEYIRRAMEVEPTHITFAGPINALAARDRAAADRLIIEHVERLRSLPLSAYAERGGGAMRITFGSMLMLFPGSTPPLWNSSTTTPPGREAVRAYIFYVLDTLERLEQAQAGGSQSARSMLTTMWPLLNQHAPELAGRFHLLERQSRTPGAQAAPFASREELEDRYRQTAEDRLKVARQTKEPLDVEVAVSSLMSKGEFAEARKLLDVLKDGDLKSKLSEEVSTRECLYLTEKGDVTGAEKLARQLTRPQSVLRAFPPLLKRLVRIEDASSASVLAHLAIRLLKEAEERGGASDTYVPSLLAPVAGSVNPFKQSRSALALSELGLSVETLGGGALALEILEEAVRTANQNRIASENGNPSLNVDLFMKLAVRDETRVRHAAARLQDRLQRISALAALYRGKAESLARGSKDTQISRY